MFRSRAHGLTLVDLLLSIYVMGVIATYTIPKVLQSQQNSKYNSAAKEAIATLSQAYQMARVKTGQDRLRGSDLTPYINYVKLDTVRNIDGKNANGSIACNYAGGGCLDLFNGGTIQYNNRLIPGTASTQALEFYFDPDGVDGGTTDGPSKSVNIFLYYNGRIVSRGTTEPNTCITDIVCFASPSPTSDPTWFGWN